VPGAAAPEEGCRPAALVDVPRLAELAAQSVDELRGNKGGAVWARAEGRRAPYEERLWAEVADPDVLVLVGTLDEAVVGFAVVGQRAVLHGTLAVLSDLYVEPAAREVGVGDVLIEAVLAWATEEGCIGVDSLALPGDRHTKNFFEAHGLVARAIVVHRSLG
jgi:GNAT superfamily N-acetyltransferase